LLADSKTAVAAEVAEIKAGVERAEEGLGLGMKIAWLWSLASAVTRREWARVASREA